MMKLLCIGCLIICGLSIPFYQLCSKTRASYAKGSSIKMPIRYLSLLNEPHIEVEIENKKYSFLIDSGSDTDLSLRSNTLRKIKNKKFINKSIYYNFKGNQYLSKIYRLAEAKIERKLTLQNLRIREEHDEAVTKGNKLQEVTNLSSKFWDRLDSWLTNGKIGNGILKHFVCYFDFPNETFCLAKDLDNLSKQGKYSLDQLISAPIEVAQFGPIVKIETKWGPKAFLLDTGSTRSLLKPENPASEEEIKSDLFLENSRLGNCCFVFRNISPLFSGIDGILGVDFFRQHVVCIDYPQKKIYISLTQLSE